MKHCRYCGQRVPQASLKPIQNSTTGTIVPVCQPCFDQLAQTNVRLDDLQHREAMERALNLEEMASMTLAQYQHLAAPILQMFANAEEHQGPDPGLILPNGA